MSCSCRFAPVRIFVQGLSQVHKVESPSFAYLRARTQLAKSTLYQPQLATVRHARSLHTSQCLNQGAATAGPDHQTTQQVEASFGAKKDPALVHQENTVQEGNQLTPAEPKPPKQKGTVGKTSETPDASPNKKTEKGVERQKWRDTRRTRADAEVEAARRREKRGVTGRGSRKDELETTVVEDAILRTPPSEPERKKPHWAIQKEALKKKFPEGWKPRKRLSPDALAGIRALNAQFPDVYTTEALASKFQVSAENIRRILRSKWTPSLEEEEERNERWHRRGQQIWETKAALGIKPPKKWRQEGITRDPSYHVWRKEAVRRNREWEEQEDREYRKSLQSRGSGKAHDG